jgi:FAD:protein FMN transferase
MHKTSFRAMGCQIMAALDTPSVRAKKRLDRVPRWFDEWEQTLSRFRDDSELSKLNRSEGERQIVSPIFWEVFRLALKISKRSSGLVNPLVLDALLDAGYSQSFELLTSSENGNSPKSGPVSGVAGISWDVQSRSVQLLLKTHLDFGGVAKGWAAHKAMNMLKISGPTLVDAGGDIAISGLRPDSQPWPVAVADPHHPGEELFLLKVSRGGIATSGRDRRRWKSGGRWQHHIIDPRTGQPAQTDVFSATVIAPSVIEAEMASKVVLILGSQQGLGWLRNHPQMAGLVILEDEQILESNNFNQYRWE